MTPKASIIIPTNNRGKIINECLDAVKKQSCDFVYEVIIINDGSTDDTSGILDSCAGINVITQEKAGPAAARNNGVKAALGEIVVFTDDDCIPEPDWPKTLLEPFKEAGISGAKGTYLTHQNELTAQFVQIEYEEKYEILKKNIFIDLVDTYSAAFRKTLFLESRGYDLALRTQGVEDREFSTRLAQKGAKFVFVPEAKVWHKHVSTPKEYLYKKFKNGYWMVYVIRKLPEIARGTSDTPITQILQIFLLPIIIITSILIPFCKMLVIPLSIFLLLFVVSAVPLIIRGYKKSFILGSSVLYFVFLRALGLSFGLIKGVCDYVLKR